MPFGLVCQNVFGTDWRSVFYQYFFEKLNKIKVHARKITVYLFKTICAELQENYWQKWIGCFEHVQILKIFILTIYEI